MLIRKELILFMGNADYLRRLLRPLGLYELDEGIGAGELDALGAELDAVSDALFEAESEAVPATAADKGLRAYEDILPYTPSYVTEKDRRRALYCLLRIDGGSFTPGAINDTISGCGIYAVAEETDTALTVRVSFPRNRGVPENFESLRKRIERIIPCHLDIEYFFVYVIWQELEDCFETWLSLETAVKSWSELEKYYAGEDA